MPPATIETVVPSRAVAGDTWRWDRVVSGYTPADGWTLKTYFRGAGALTITGAAASGDASWENTAAATSTKTLPAGQYRWQEFVSNVAGERYRVGAGVLVVEPNPELQNAGDAVPFEEKAVAALEAYIAGSVDEGILEFTIAGRAVKLMSPAEATDLRDRYAERLARRRTGGRRPPIVPEFRRVG